MSETTRRRYPWMYTITGKLKWPYGEPQDELERQQREVANLRIAQEAERVKKEMKTKSIDEIVDSMLPQNKSAVPCVCQWPHPGLAVKTYYTAHDELACTECGRIIVSMRQPMPEVAPANEAVNHPAHYTFGTIEPIDVIEDWGLGFEDGNAVKYIARARHKGRQLEDLKKARWYLDRLIARLGKS